ncbi:MAG TPA: ABC transporter permease [Acidimicrobiia bacterium]|nr:ABC transporter permease [Acidimicrobiia bacterium]
MLESADPKVAPNAIAAAVEAETPSEETYKKRGIGVFAWISIGWIVFIVVIAFLAPVLPLKSPMIGDYAHPNAAAFSPGHLLGSDASGRDVLSRVIWGARASLLLAVGSVLFGVLIGGLLGLIAGFRGRTTDTVLSGGFNILLAFPQLVLALTLVSVLAPLKTESNGAPPAPHEWAHRILVVILAVGIVSIPILARITRASAISWTQREFVMAARAQGASERRVMFREVLPNVLPAMLSIALLGVAIVLVLEGALAVFGVSIQEPNPSWGNMIYSQLSDLSASPAVWIVPSLLIFLTVLALNYLGDVVRSRFDVRESVL